MKRAVELFPNDVRLVYRHYPLRQIHPQAQAAAEAAEAAGIQGKFFEMHDLLFERQSSWAGSSSARSTFESYAEELELDLEQFKADVKSDAVKDKIDNDYSSGLQSGIQGTPSFFFNGTRIQNPSGFEPLRQMIEAELKRIEENTSVSIDHPGNFTIDGNGVVKEAEENEDEE
jgi:protein-disulfide isomerase